jgi:hypothetical protein
MRIVWDVLETVDRVAFSALDQVDRLLRRPPLLERTKERTKDVRPPQRVIEFEN